MIYVMSDIHGNQRRFNSVMEQINLQRSDTLYVLGDVIDRHPDGIHLLRYIMEAPNIQMLLGNHEYMMLRALGVPYDGPEDIQDKAPEALMNTWYQNGGDITHHCLKHIRKTIRADIFDYLHTLPLNINLEVGERKFKLVHAAPVELFDPERHYKHSSETHFAVWDRDALFSMDIPSDLTVIFGHTPTEHFQNDNPLCIWQGRDCLGIDCGSGFPEERQSPFPEPWGRLACLRLDDMHEFYSEEPNYPGKKKPPLPEGRLARNPYG